MTNTTPVRPRILVVEDDRAIYAAVHTLLSHYEYDVILARTLAEARKQLDRAPDLVVLDVILPDGEGLDLIDRMREINCKARVIVLTGSPNLDHERRIRRLKPAKYFRKPLNFFELLEGIREEISSITARGAAAQPALI